MLWDGFLTIFTMGNLTIIFLGVLIGILVGALPGLTATLTIALLLPFSFGLTPLASITLMVAVYIGAIYGGSIAAILLNIPGTPAAAATLLDGHPLTLKGQAGKALSTAAIASFSGGLIGAILMILFSPSIAKIALNFSAPEFFGLAVFGLTIIASVSGKSLLKGLLAACFGLIVATVGLDRLTASPRYTFDTSELMAGFSLVPLLIGLFGVSEVLLYLDQKHEIGKRVKTKVSTKMISLKEGRGIIGTILRSSAIGSFIGAIPGAAGDIAAFASYNETKRWSKTPEEFGKGSLKGVAAAETGNSAVTSGSMIPLLTLGIPGDAAAAVMLGAFLIHGLQPGPKLFEENSELVYGLFAGMIIANIVMLIIGLLFVRQFARIIGLDMRILMPIIIVLTGIGSFAINNTMFDVYVMLVFGVIGYFLSKLEIPASPIVLAVILGPMAEENFRRAYMQHDGSFSFLYDRPITLILLLIALITFSTALWSAIKKWVRTSKE